jgi:hypothetical protein
LAGAAGVKRRYPGLAGALLAASLIAMPAVATLATAGPAWALANAPLNLSGEVDPGQCPLCHEAISVSKNPDLIFSHGSHLIAVCTDCHQRNPHAPNGTFKPTMDSCFNCHEMQRGTQAQMKKGACRTCHPSTFALRPSSHGADWAKAPHVGPARSQSNRCALCHTDSQCKPCHDRLRVKGDFVLASYVPTVVPAPKRPTFVDPTQPASPAQCQQCHQDFDRFKKVGIEAGRTLLSHSPHVKKGFRCVACHQRFPHNPDGITPPRMRECYSCHGVHHGPQGQVAAQGCDLCHPEGFDLVPPDHRPTRTWLATHGPIARKDLSNCYMCHQFTYCVPCHLRGQRLPPTPSNALLPAVAAESTVPKVGMVIPPDHRTQQWLVQHGVDFLNKGGQCSPCHTGELCYQCHKTPLPHPPDWLTSHSASAKIIGHTDCNVCHHDRSACQTCHHTVVGNLLCEAKNCVKCHPESTLPWRQVKDVGMIVHAAHWKSKYRCGACHFGYNRDLRNADVVHSYSFDLCAGCHGAKNAKGSVIATPAVGAPLCLDCHPKMRL